jgi:hypothetical protein
MACAEPPCARTGRARVRPSAWSAGGPSRERRGGNPGMNGHGQSDRSVVPANPPNKAAAAEAGEERERTKGNTDSETRPGRSAGLSVSSELGRVRQVAVRDKEARFTALLHHVTLERLLLAYQGISPKAAPGADGVTWEACGQDLAANLRDTCTSGCSRGATGLVRRGGRTFRRRTGGCGRSASPRWRTRSSSGPSWRYSTPSTRRISGASPTGSGRAAAPTRRWMPWRPGSRPGE